ncbi:hypothetical protein [Sulfurisoma sediminicola]|uniref:Uncharacterized protein n=1 Tax=Sulfurisoma sediminicola TaxID=1381557 RepID=A0A497XFC9_9PROT|nr:hypothetical protein [Sulfurisoma sediminicola]RLJ64837.1 hypothetical protein DFR35_1485 [Sulfurisoma sediminicola]
MTTSRRKRQKIDTLDLPLDDANLTLPAATIPNRRGATTKSKPVKGKRTQTGSNPQAFLPGMSRRGRPRAKVAVAASERAANSRRRRLATGAKRVELVLDADTLGKLDGLADHLKESRAGVVNWLVARAAARLLK